MRINMFRNNIRIFCKGSCVLFTLVKVKIDKKLKKQTNNEKKIFLYLLLEEIEINVWE